MKNSKVWKLAVWKIIWWKVEKFNHVEGESTVLMVKRFQLGKEVEDLEIRSRLLML